MQTDTRGKETKEGENIMPIIHLIVILVAIGVIMWLVNNYIPMAEPYKKIMNVVVIIFVVLWLLSIFIGFGDFSSYRIGR
jgi:amino acid transporter